MRRRFLPIALLFVITNAVAQQKGDSNIQTIERNKADNTPSSIVFSETAPFKKGQGQQLFRDYFGIDGANNKVTIANTTTTKQHTTIERYEQYYKGIRVEHGAYTILYNKEDKARFMNGNIYSISYNPATTPSLSENTARAKALAAVNAQTYAWQLDGLENHLKQETNDLTATYFPKGELVWVEDASLPQPDRKLHLAYRFNVYATAPLSRENIYIDAASGKVLQRNSLIDHTAGSGPSLYSGTVSFKTSIISGVNKLRDSTRGSGINTFTCANTTGSTINDVTSTTSTWASDPALDAHWGAEKVFDYWLNEQGRNSFNNAGAAINSYVHYAVNYDNAFWNGSQMVYGDGSGGSGGFSPLTSLDVCAHEIGHAICQYSANLAYNKESGAMNEGFSDIWGAIIEEYADPHETDAMAKNMWKIGEEIGVNPIRRMDNPNIRFQPDTYGGSFWVSVVGCTPSSGNDYCGVHTNSGVLNYWFYLLCTGGSGTNDIGNAFSVTGIGTNKGADIAYQTELLLTSSSTYANCRTASINAATTLYGACSPEVEAVTRAWYAVGVGANYSGGSITAITGSSALCAGSTITLANATSGGTWTSSNTANATVGSTTGVVTGIAAGTVNITYTVAGGCYATKSLTINITPTLSAITGATTLCQSTTTTLGNTTTGGTWTSSNTSTATVGSSTGTVTAIASGTTTITYTFSNICGSASTTHDLTVNPLPSAITGTTTTSIGGTTTLSNATPGGTWTSSNTAVATINTASGLVTGVTGGTTTISYTLPTGCPATVTFTVSCGTITTINTILGTGTGADGGSGGAGTSTDIHFPWGVGTDAAGNVYLSDYGNHKIRKLSPSGIVTTIAGTGVYGYSGDGGPATAAKFSYNTGLAVYGTNVYVADRENARIRKIDASGIITTVAGNGTTGYSGDGGQATAAKISDPNGLCVDAAGNIYIPEQGNHRVRKVSTSGIITTVAGTGAIGTTGDGGQATAAKFIIPNGVTVDAAGNLYISDYSANKIRRVDAGTGIITTYAGNGSTGYSGDGVAATATSIQGPAGLAIDNDGNLIICDVENNRIRKVNATTGIITTIAGTGTAGFSGDGGDPTLAKIERAHRVHCDVAGNIYIADIENQRLRKISSGLINISGTATVCTGGTVTLTGNPTGGTWSSGSTAVATVGASSGIVTGVSAGTAIISYANSGGCTATMVVTVNDISPITTGDTLPTCGLQAWYPFNGNANNSYGPVYNGRVTGATLTTDRFGNTNSAYHFNGIGNKITIDTAFFNVGWDNYTISCWINSEVLNNTNNANHNQILFNTIPHNGFGIGNNWTLSGKYSMWQNNNPASATWNILFDKKSNTNVSTNNWKHIVMQKKNDTSYSLYVNGVLDTTYHSSVSAIDYYCKFVIGNVDSSAGTEGFWGKLDDYGIWNCALSDAEISQLYTMGTATTSICVGSTTVLTNATAGGTWSSGNTAVATIGMSSGIATGIAPGTAMISYVLSSGCYATTVLTVTGITPITSGDTLPTCGLLAWYPFNGNTNNSYGPVYRGRITGASLTTDRFGNANSAYHFNGDGDRITIDTAFFNIGWDDITISCWSNSEVLSNSHNGNHSQFAFNTIPHNGMILGYNWGGTSNKYSMFANSYPSPFSWDIIWQARSKGSVAINTWRHLVMKKSGGHNYSFYLNGILDTTYTSSTAASDYYCKFVMGNNDSSVGYEGFQGKLDDYGIWHCALSDAEIWQLYTMGASDFTVCVGNTITLSNATTGGTWSSSNTSVATIGSSSGIVSGVAAGTTTITYTVSSGCIATATVTVNGAITSGSITGPSTVSVAATIALSHPAPGGTWSASNSNATVSSTGVVTGVTAGTVYITYTISSSCGSSYATKLITVASTIGGTLILCEGNSTMLSSYSSGGAWTSGNTAVAIVVPATGLVTGIAAGTATISYTVAASVSTVVVSVYATPAAITGASTVCVGSTTALASTSTGGTWSSSNNTIATVSLGGIVTGVSAGTTIISYAFGTGCFRSISMTVNPLPAAISGATSICVGGMTTLICSTSGGVSWTSSNPAVATIGLTSGNATGASAGTTNITYTISTGCQSKVVLTVNDVPTTISGSLFLCNGTTTALSSSPSGGTWSSSNTAIATVATSGIVSGVGPGYVTITYTTGIGCSTTAVVTVGAVPAAITGIFTLCAGSTTALHSASPGCTWSSDNTSVATISTSGVVTGISLGTATISYTHPLGCAKTATVNITAGAPANTGTPTVCVGATTTLSNATSGGTWNSSNTGKATVISATGVVTGVSAGTAKISYNLSGGCRSITQITVNATLATITGATTLCIGTTTTLSHAISSGTWSSSNTAIATIGSASGIVTGISAGTAIITYSAAGCFRTATISVNSTPAGIGGVAAVCIGATTTLTNSTTGGTWSSSNTSIATITSGGVVSGISAGTSEISYTTGIGCITSIVVTVSTGIDPITGIMFLCNGSTSVLSGSPSGGIWSSSNTAIATVGTDGTVTGTSGGYVNISYTIAGCSAVAAVTVGAVPAVITGALTVCTGLTTTLYSATPGCVWSSSNTAVATIGSTGIVTALSSGTTTISYTHPLGCIRTVEVTVSAGPDPITGTLTVCAGSATALSSTTPGGVWASSSVGIAIIGSLSGILTGLSAGIVNISYYVGGCRTTTTVTVTAPIASISGVSNVCVGQTITLSHATSGGIWTSSNVSQATVGSSSGIVTGIAAGTPTITYSLGATCYKTKYITVNGGSAAITGSTSVCQGSTTVLSCATPGGTSWTSSNTAVATIGITSGVVSGISTGTSEITYLASTGCTSTTIATVIALPTAISGTLIVCQGSTTALSSVGTTGGTWVSSTLAKAIVGSSTGIVSGINGGTSTITYTWTNTCKRTAVVTVNPFPVAGAITGAGSMSVTATQTLASSSPGGTWSSSDVSKATMVSGSGFMTGVSVGLVTISYTQTNGCGSSIATRVFSITASRPVAPLATADMVKFSAYPNPTSGSLTVETNVSGMFTMFSIDGKQIAQYTIAAPTTSIALPYQLAAGIYMCRFNGNDGSTVMVRLVYEQ